MLSIYEVTYLVIDPDHMFEGKTMVIAESYLDAYIQGSRFGDVLEMYHKY